MNTHFRAHEIVLLIEFASTELHISFSTRAVARVFEVGHSAVKRAQLRGYDHPPARGRHYELAADAEQQLVNWTTAKAANSVAVNRTEFLHKCNERFGKIITRGWVDSFLTRHAKQLFEIKSVPYENPRFEVLRVFLQARLDIFRDHVHPACAKLVFNFDEIGISEREDCSTRMIIAGIVGGSTLPLFNDILRVSNNMK
jgi:hypothetical protein